MKHIIARAYIDNYISTKTGQPFNCLVDVCGLYQTGDDMFNVLAEYDPFSELTPDGTRGAFKTFKQVPSYNIDLAIGVADSFDKRIYEGDMIQNMKRYDDLWPIDGVYTNHYDLLTYTVKYVEEEASFMMVAYHEGETYPLSFGDTDCVCICGNRHTGDILSNVLIFDKLKREEQG